MRAMAPTGLLAGYQALAGTYDELFGAEGPRPAFARMVPGLDGYTHADFARSQQLLLESYTKSAALVE